MDLCYRTMCFLSKQSDLSHQPSQVYITAHVQTDLILQLAGYTILFPSGPCIGEPLIAQQLKQLVQFCRYSVRSKII